MPIQKKSQKSILDNRGIKKTISQIDDLLSQANLNLYGTDRNSEVDVLDKKFQEIINGTLDSLNDTSSSSKSFMGQVGSNERGENAIDSMINQQLGAINDGNIAQMEAFITEAYKNRLIEQADLHEVSSSLIELSEAILITRDAIISPDVVEGRISRTLGLENSTDEVEGNYIPAIEQMEKKFHLLEKIKDFVIPKSLEYGEYYAYTIPYSKLFNDFVRDKNKIGSSYTESTLYESVNSGPLKYTTAPSGKRRIINKTDEFIDKMYTEYAEKSGGVDSYGRKLDKTEFETEMSAVMNNITICNESVPLPVLEEGFDSIEAFMESFVSADGRTEINQELYTESGLVEEKTAKSIYDPFKEVIDAGIIHKNKKSRKENFDDVPDCYIKLIDPTKIIPVKIMSKVIGYYYIKDEAITPIGGNVTSNLYVTAYDERSSEQTIIDSITNQIVNSFDREYLKKNAKFKDTIAEAISYYNLNEKKLKFQYIPLEYMQAFKIDVDEEGNGRSMIKKSLFYAKLYLMLLLFKIMSIILNSNDTKVNYIRTSGIDKNVANKIQEIARKKRNRQVNIYDLFNYTSLINKVGNGSEMYVPTGRNNERPMETEILSGQDVQLNTELLEMLKNAYILACGVPNTMINYLSEADFAKIVEQNNTKFNGRVVNYQLDYNSQITDWYKKIMRSCTTIPNEIIDKFTFTLQSPKAVNGMAKQEVIGTFTQNMDFIKNTYFGDAANEPENADKVRELTKLMADELLPMLNLAHIDELVHEAEIRAAKKKLEPKAENGTDDDIDLSDFS